MATVLQTDPVPLREDESGALRVGNTRVLLELVVAAYEEGATPEEIVQRFETLELSEVYAVIAYFLRHRGSVQEYLAKRESAAADVRRQIEASQGDLSEIRTRLEKRRAAQG